MVSCEVDDKDAVGSEGKDRDDCGRVKLPVIRPREIDVAQTMKTNNVFEAWHKAHDRSPLFFSFVVMWPFSAFGRFTSSSSI